MNCKTFILPLHEVSFTFSGHQSGHLIYTQVFLHLKQRLHSPLYSLQPMNNDSTFSALLYKGLNIHKLQWCRNQLDILNQHKNTIPIFWGMTMSRNVVELVRPIMMEHRLKKKLYSFSHQQAFPFLCIILM